MGLTLTTTNYMICTVLIILKALIFHGQRPIVNTDRIKLTVKKPSSMTTQSPVGSGLIFLSTPLNLLRYLRLVLSVTSRCICSQNTSKSAALFCKKCQCNINAIQVTSTIWSHSTVEPLYSGQIKVSRWAHFRTYRGVLISRGWNRGGSTIFKF